MKKKVFRERYNLVNGNGEVVKEGLTIEEVKEMIKDAQPEAKNAVKVKIELEPKKRGRRKSVKSDK